MEYLAMVVFGIFVALNVTLKDVDANRVVDCVDKTEAVQIVK